MITWEYNSKDFKESLYQLIPAGNYRVRIEEATEAESSTGKKMIKMKLKVSGYRTLVWHNLLLDQTDAKAVKRTNQKLGQLYDSFDIPEGSFELDQWKGKIGGAYIKEDRDDKGRKRSNVGWFILRDEQYALPMFEEVLVEEETVPF